MPSRKERKSEKDHCRSRNFQCYSIGYQIYNVHKPIVLRIEKKVGTDDGDTDSDDGENDENEEHKAVHVVDLVGPEGREDEIHLDKDRSEWQNPGQGHKMSIIAVYDAHESAKI